MNIPTQAGRGTSSASLFLYSPQRTVRGITHFTHLGDVFLKLSESQRLIIHSDHS